MSGKLDAGTWAIEPTGIVAAAAFVIPTKRMTVVGSSFLPLLKGRAVSDIGGRTNVNDGYGGAPAYTAGGGKVGVCDGSARRSMIWVAVLILGALAAIPIAAQLPTGTILGTVKDSSGASIPGAMVTLKNTDTNLTKTATTEADGSYRFPELAVGRYEITASAAGFRTENRTGLTLEVTQTGVINFALQVGATTQQVTISSEIPLVNTQDATLGGTVHEQQMAELPLNGRNYIDLTLLKPGVNKDVNQRNSQGTSFSVNGAPPRSNNFTLDGAILQTSNGRSPVAGESGDALGLDGIKEYQTVTGTFQAEYGLAMGSQIVAVSKGGTNQFHGDAFDYLRNSALDANTFRN